MMFALGPSMFRIDGEMGMFTIFPCPSNWKRLHTFLQWIVFQLMSDCFYTLICCTSRIHPYIKKFLPFLWFANCQHFRSFIIPEEGILIARQRLVAINTALPYMERKHISHQWIRFSGAQQPMYACTISDKHTELVSGAWLSQKWEWSWTMINSKLVALTLVWWLG